MWLYVPQMSYPSVVASPDSISASDWRFQTLERCATLIAKPTASKSWFRAYKTKPYVTRLFGRILEPSIASRGVESWIGSLVGIHVNHSACQGKGGEQTRDTCGQTSSGSSQNSNLHSASSRTSADICLLASRKSCKTWKEWTTALRATFLQRMKSAVPFAGKSSLYLPRLTAREFRDSSKARILASLDRGDGVAKRICNISPTLRSSEETVFLNPSFGDWLMGFPIEWSDYTHLVAQSFQQWRQMLSKS